MFLHAARRFKILSRLIFLVAVFWGIDILGVFSELPMLPCKVILARATRAEADFHDGDVCLYLRAVKVFLWADTCFSLLAFVL